MGKPSPKPPKKKTAKTEKAKKAAAVEMAERIKHVAELMLEGYSNGEIMETIIEHFGVKERQARTYLEKARQKFTQNIEADFQTNLTLALARRLMIFRKCMDSRNYRDAHAVLQDHDRLTGLYRLAEAAAEPTEQTEKQILIIDENTTITF